MADDSTTDDIFWYGIIAFLDTPTCDGRIITEPPTGTVPPWSIPIPVWYLTADHNSVQAGRIDHIECADALITPTGQVSPCLIATGLIYHDAVDLIADLDAAGELGLGCGVDLEVNVMILDGNDICRITDWTLHGVTIYDPVGTAEPAFPYARIRRSKS